MLNQRGEALAGRLSAPGARGVAEVQDFLLLQSVNRWQKLLSHWTDSGNVHPEDLYATLVQMVGEFATFTETSRRPNSYPAYRHEDLQRSLAPVVADLRRSLSAVLETNAVSIPLQDRRNNMRVGPLSDRTILRNSSFVLSVQANVPSENLRRLFPSQVKIGAVEHIRELVTVALPGISVRPMGAAPRQIPFYAGATYFELDRNSPHWQQMQSSGGFAIHVSGDFPELKMELWAIRGSGGLKQCRAITRSLSRRIRTERRSSGRCPADVRAARRPQRPARHLQIKRRSRRPRFRGRMRQYGSAGRRYSLPRHLCCSCCHGCATPCRSRIPAPCVSVR